MGDMRLVPLLVPLLLTAALLAGCPDPEPVCTGGNPTDISGRCLPDCDGTRVGNRCVVAGVPEGECGTGFASDGEGGCTVVRPDAPCTGTELARPGETSCAPVMDCGTGDWGNLERPAGTLHVLASAAAGGTGTEAAPFATIADALNAAGPGTVIAVGPGTYNESIYPNDAVLLRGVCPEKVTVDGTGDGIALRVEYEDGVQLSGMTLIGPDASIGVLDSVDVVVDHVVVTGSEIGVLAFAEDGPTRLELADSLVQGVEQGVTALGAEVTLRRSVVRKIASTVPINPAIAVLLGMDTVATARVGSLTIEGSVVEDVVGFGVAVRGGTADITDTYIGQTTVNAGGDGGVGLVLLPNKDPAAPVSGTVKGSVIADAGVVGLNAETSELLLDHTVITGVRADTGEDAGGFCLVVEVDDNPASDRQVPVALLDSAIGPCATSGIYVGNVDSVFTRTAITYPGASVTTDAVGQGLTVMAAVGQPSPSVTLTDVTVDHAVAGGIMLFAATAEAHGLVVRDVTRVTDEFGDGIIVTSLANSLTGEVSVGSFTGDHVFVEGAARAGLAAFGSDLTLSNSQLTCNGLDLNAQDRFGDWPGGDPLTRVGVIVDDGGNTCGCESTGECHVESQTLKAAPPPGAPAAGL